jgi:endonuclease V-like protein UPF0215 family
MRLHLNKKAIRALGVAESFKVGDKKSILAGVVMRTDLVIDGFIFGSATVEGDDATRKMVQMYKVLHRNDINIILLSGCIISLYNIVDVDSLAEKTKVPVICLTYKESDGIEEAIRHHFGSGATKKIAMYRSLGGREKFILKTGSRIFVRASGIMKDEIKRVLESFTLQGGIPEPVRVAKILARARRL